MLTLDRRTLVTAGLSWMFAAAAAPATTAPGPAPAPGAAPAPVPTPPVAPNLGPASPFSFERLSALAKSMAAKPYAAPATKAADILNGIDADTAQKIRFRPERALLRGAPNPYPISLFHLNKYAAEPVKIFMVSRGTAREVLYGPQYFDYGTTGLDTKLPADAGFSGFRVMDSQVSPSDWLAFQGASYFRSSGSDNQYGASARGIAINTALSTKEEFPRFSQFWLEEAGSALTIYALLDGPSITGAYRVTAVKNDTVVMEIHAELFTRADIARLGFAPLTSMYWYGENMRERALDWRPEVHDSDGLSLWTGKGERIWRPLINPPAVQTNSFADVNPKGFGLMQRDRVFDDYQDDGAFYNNRPGIWVEPHGDWGEGAVQLVEIPTDDETHDNIVAYWQPKSSITSGETFTLDYKLYWQDREPDPASGGLARVVATRTGRGGVPGVVPPSPGKHKFVIDFEGGPLAQMERRFDVTPVVTTSRGKIEMAYVVKVVGTNRWRALFDLNADGKDVVNLRCFLRLADKTLSETWLYQYFP